MYSTLYTSTIYQAAVREKKDDEADTMMSMFGDFSRSQTIVREKTMVGKSAQKEKLAGILVSLFENVSKVITFRS